MYENVRVYLDSLSCLNLLKMRYYDKENKSVLLYTEKRMPKASAVSAGPPAHCGVVAIAERPPLGMINLTAYIYYI